MTLQKLLFDCNYEEISELLQKLKFPNLKGELINTTDFRNQYPIFLCIYIRENFRKIGNIEKSNTMLEIFELLLNNNGKIRIRNEERRTPLEEVIAYVRSNLNLAR